MDTSTIIWIVVIAGAMIFNSVSKVRKAREKGVNPPSQHGEAWPSIPWDEEKRPAASKEPVVRPEQPRMHQAPESTGRGPRKPVRTPVSPLPKRPPGTQESDDQHLPPTNGRQSGDCIPTRNDANVFPDECQSLEETPFEEYTPELIEPEMADFADLYRPESSPEAEQSAVASGRSEETGRKRIAHPEKPSQNRAESSEEKPDRVASPIEEFDLRRAVIYSEILKPKFEEE